MLDLRPVFFVIGVVVTCFGMAMIPPMLLDLFLQNGAWTTFAVSGFVTMLLGLCLGLSTLEPDAKGLTIKQTYIMVIGVFALLPVFGAVPFMTGPANLSFTDAFFEAMSGLTTTGSTILTDLSNQHAGILLWRGMLQWFGGVSVIIVALVILPLLRIGGMQLFRWDSYDALGNVLPRATQYAKSISAIYLGLSAVCMFCYLLAGLELFDAVVYTMTTIATGGFGNHDSSFQELGAAAEYVGVVFMLLASLPFIRYVQLTEGDYKLLFKDSQIRCFLEIIAVVVVVLIAWQILVNGEPFERAFRQSLFNGVSILTGSGFSSADYGSWGTFPLVLFFAIGLIGGCAGSTTCSVKVFRFQLLFATIWARMQKIRSPYVVAFPHYEGRSVPNEVIQSVLLFLIIFFGTLAVTTVLLSLTGLDLITSLSGAATALANVGPGLGDQIGPEGNFSGLSDFAKWVLSFVMLAGRLELIAVYAVLSVGFWKN